MKKTAGLFLAALAGCAAPAPEPEGSRDALAVAFQESLAASHLLAHFEGIADGDRAVKGTARWYRSGVLLVDMEEKGGGRVRLLRIGGQAWIFDEAAQAWTDAARAGRAEDGMGFAHPFELISALSLEAQSFKGRHGGFVLRDTGSKGGEYVKPLLRGADKVKAETRLGVRVEVGESHRMRIEFSGRVGSRRCMASVDIRSSATPPPMQFDDIPSPFTPEMNAAVRKATEAK